MNSKETIELRLQAAAEEFQYIKYYNFVVINDDFEHSVLQLKNIMNGY